MLQKKNKKINTRLGEIGKILNMSSSDVVKSKRTIRNMICVCIATGVISIIGFFLVTRQDSIGLWYISPSLKDFNFFRGLF